MVITLNPGLQGPREFSLWLKTPFHMLLFRRMQFKDLLNVQRLNVRNSTENFLLSTFLNTLSMSYNTSFVAEQDGSIVGYIEALVDVDKRKGHIYSLCVDGPFRRHGLGRKLISLAVSSIKIELSKEKGLCEIDLHVRTENTRAIALYSTMGFVIVEAEVPYYESGMLAHRMSIQFRK